MEEKLANESESKSHSRVSLFSILVVRARVAVVPPTLNIFEKFPSQHEFGSHSTQHTADFLSCYRDSQSTRLSRSIRFSTERKTSLVQAIDLLPFALEIMYYIWEFIAMPANFKLCRSLDVEWLFGLANRFPLWALVVGFLLCSLSLGLTFDMNFTCCPFFLRLLSLSLR